MSDEIGLETAWYLYRAIREYDAVKNALYAARDAVIGQRETRRHDEEVFDPEGLDSTYSRYTVRETQNFMRHAASLAARHNLNDDRVVAVITPDGLHAVVQAIWRELMEGEATERSWFVRGAPNFFAFYPPIMFSRTNGITLNPFAYRDEQAFMAHMMQELPLLYRRLQTESVAARTRAAEAEALAEEKHTKKVERVLTTLNRKPTTALHKAWENGDAIPDPFAPLWLRVLPPDDRDPSNWRVGRDDAAMRAALSKVGFSDRQITFALQYCVYHVPTRRWYEWTRRVHRSVENNEWRGSPLPADLNERAAALRKGRMNPLSALDRHARWWAAHKVDGVSQRKMATDEGVARSYVNESIHSLERFFAVV